MNVFNYLACAALLFLAAPHPAPAQAASNFLPLPEGLVPLDSPRGRQIFQASGNEPFWRLTQFYAPQPDLGSCSVASCAMVLNALPIERPISKPHGKYRLFTPDNFFTPGVEAIASRKKVSAAGMTLQQLALVLQTFPVTVEWGYASDITLPKFRAKVKETTQQPDKYMLVNYLRKSLDQESGGHISPLGAYNEADDMVLIIDTANYKYPWTWAKLEDLWKAMKEAADPESGKTRGFVVVSPSHGG